MNVCDMIWSMAGHPLVIDSVQRLVTDQPGTCAVTGGHYEQTAPIDKALGANFLDRSLFHAHSPRVGPAALWVCCGKPPATLRMWSVVATPGVAVAPSNPKAWLQDVPGLCLTNRADPRPVTATLLNPPVGDWVVTVAVSGQKHVVPYATINHGPGPWAVRYESTTVTSDPGTFGRILTAAANLRAAGHSTDDVLAGTPSMAACKTPDDLEWWSRQSDILTQYAHSGLLSLALWCLTKETINDHRTPRPDPRSASAEHRRHDDGAPGFSLF